MRNPPASLFALGLGCTLALGARVASAQSPGCSVRGTAVDVERIVVAPPGAPAFTLRVEHAEVAARPARSPAAHPVHVRASLEFDGASDALPYAIAAPTWDARRLVRLSPAMELASVRAAGGGLVLDASYETYFTLRGVPMPCAALTLDTPARDPHPPRVDAPVDGTTWVSRGTRLRLSARPGGPPAVDVALRLPLAARLERITRRGELWQVIWRGADGSSFQGWVHRAALVPAPDSGFGSTGGRGRLGCTPGRRTAPGLYHGPARVGAGAEVYASAGEGRWGTVTADTDTVVEHQAGESWVRLVAMPRVFEDRACGELTHAFVPLSAVALPPDAH